MSLRFEWDPAKAAANIRKHRVSFPEAATCFADPRSITVADPEHSRQEDRYVTIGLSFRGRLLVIVHTDRDETIRIISARRALAKERRHYEEN